MVDKEEEEPTVLVRGLRSVPPPQGLAFRFADGHIEPITAMVAIPGETFPETLDRVAKELGAEVVTRADA